MNDVYDAIQLHGLKSAKKDGENETLTSDYFIHASPSLSVHIAMFEFHQDKRTYFDYQYRTAKEYILPFVRKNHPLPQAAKVLEIGCGEAGVLKAFLEEGCECVGIELHESGIETVGLGRRLELGVERHGRRCLE